MTVAPQRRSSPFRFAILILLQLIGAGPWLQALEPRINEFMASNKHGLHDEDGAEVDWLEIYNPNPIPQDLAGWYLTDDPAVPNKWKFPVTSINPNGYLIVFASGKDRAVAGSNLHTNFSLKATGETIALVKPDGVTVVSQFVYGPQYEDISYGVTSLTTSQEILVPANAAARALVPMDGSLGTDWTAATFDDSTWQGGTLAVGYENATGYETLLGLDVRAAMNGINTSCYVRIPFAVSNISDVLGLTLRMRYDDGFAVYLNGTLLSTAGRNAPAPLTYQSSATADHPDTEAVLYEDISLNEYVSLLNASQTNVLAIHGLNVGLTSSDFLIGPQLILTHGTLDVGYMPTPTPGGPNGSGVQGFVGDTHFSQHRGFYTAPFNVTLTCDTPGAVIRFTRNGDTPTATTGTIYTSPILINSTTTLRAAAFINGFQPSNVDTQTYLFLDDVIHQSADGSAPAGWPAASVNGQRFDYGMDPDVVNGLIPNAATPAIMKTALLAIPTVSLVTDLANLTDPTTGIYVSPFSRGEDAERPVSLEIINDPLNPSPTGFQQNAGLRIRGGFSRDPNNPKHSFRLFFRSDYGKGKMDYEWFGDTSSSSFDSIDLRTSQDASWAYLGSPENTFLRDESSRATQLVIAPASRVRCLHVYVNGQYWGLYNTDERPNKGYGAQYFGGNEADYDVLKSSGSSGGYATEASDGTMEQGSAWNLLWTGAHAVRNINTTTANTNYFKLMGLGPDGVTPTGDPVLLDPVNLADYLLVLFYMGGDDGPVSDYVGASNNWFGVRNRVGSKGFKFFIHDFEQSLGLESQTNQRVGNGTLLRPWSNTVRGLTDYTRSNPEFIHEDLCWSPEYRSLFADRAHKHFFNNGAMTNANVLARMQNLATIIDTAIWGESARWGDSVRPTPFLRTDWLAANQRMYNFITYGTTENIGTGRVNEVIRQLNGYDGSTKRLYPSINAPVFSQHGGGIPATGLNITMTQSNSSSNVIFYTINGKDPRAIGGGITSEALIYSGPVAVTGWTASVRARVRNNGVTWSALNEAVFARSTGPPPLKIVEIMAAPAPPTPAEVEYGYTDKDDFEFIEILNTGTEAVNLRDVRLFRGVECTFSDVFLAPGERGVVVHRIATFRQRYGNGPKILGEFIGSLNDGGNRLTLTSALGATISDFAYDGADPWPQGLQGSSLVLRSPTLDPSQPSSWRSSVNVYGSPGTSDSITYAAWKTGAGITSETTDSDQDGMLPLLEYASGGSPTTNDANRNPTAASTTIPGSPAAQFILFSYLRRRGADDLQATIEQSTNLSSWTASAAELISVVAREDGTELVTVRTLPMTTTGPKAFLHVRWQVLP